MKLHVQGWSRVGTLLPIIGHRSGASTVADASSDNDSLRASFNRQAPKSEAAPPTRHVLFCAPDDQHETVSDECVT